MPTNDDSSPDVEVEDLLHRGVEVTASDWSDVRARFALRALSQGLIDVAYEDHETPLGGMRITATPTGIVRTILPAEDADDVLGDLSRKISPRLLKTGTPAITLARRELDEYFAGTRRDFDVPLDWSLSQAFRRKVLTETAKIPYGETASYGQLATAAGSPRAVRAAGSALARNPLPILVPCHRVLPASGGVGQYLGGAAAKAQLLALETGVAS